MKKPRYFTPKYPPRHSVMEESMGRFMLVWGVLEVHLDSGIAAIYCLEPTLALGISANSGTKAKLDMLHTGISMSSDFLSESLSERAHKSLNKISDLSGRHRNALAHGSPVEAPDGWRWHRVSARQSLDVTYFYAPATRWKKAATEVRKATREWCRVYQEIHQILERVPKDIRDASYHYVPKDGK